jgi:hypothetical protein
MSEAVVRVITQTAPRPTSTVLNESTTQAPGTRWTRYMARMAATQPPLPPAVVRERGGRGPITVEGEATAIPS